MYWYILVVAVLVYICLKIYLNVYYWELRSVKHVKPLPFLGSFGKNMFGRMSLVDQVQMLYNSYPEAKFIGTHQLSNPVLMIRDPEFIKDITVKRFDHFIDHTVMLTEDIDPLFGKNLVSLRGQRWRHMRATLSPAFTGSKMRAMYHFLKECGQQFAQYFLEEEKKGPLVVEMKDIFSKYTNDVIATSAFGIKCDSLKEPDNTFYLTGKEVSSFGFLTNLKLIGIIATPRLMKFFNVKLFSDRIGNFFRNIINRTVETREREGIIRPDMIHLLMEARKGQLKHESKDDQDAGFATVEESNIGKEEVVTDLTMEDITAQALLFFLAGYDTASTMMSFMAYELAINPEIQAKLHAEIDDILEECEGDIKYEAILKMKYLDMVISESLRKWPPAPMTDRVCVKPCILNDTDQTILLNKGQSVWMPVYALQNDPKYFPNPEKFDPERFNDENKNNIVPFTYMPFGVGPRNCIGSRFALLEIKALFVHLLAKFNLKVVKKTQVPLQLKKYVFNMASEKGIWLGLESRNLN